MEAEDADQPVDTNRMLGALESAAGLRIQMDEEGLKHLREDPRVFLDRVPELIEASMGLRIWAGVVQTVERRLGESLGLEPSLPQPIDWDAAEMALLGAYDQVTQTRDERLLAEIDTDLHNALRKEAGLTEQQKLRLLIQMSYGQRSYFDRKTHQRQSVLVGRLTYPFYAAGLLEDADMEELELTILEHLHQAQAAIEFGLGRAEIARLAGTRLDQLDERSREVLKEGIGPAEFEALDPTRTIGDFPPQQQDHFSQALGAQGLMRAYRELFLSVADRLWVDYLTQMEALRTSIGLEAYGQRDPLVQYKSRAFDLFQELLDAIRAGVVSRMYRLRAAGASQSAAVSSTQAPQGGQPVPAAGNGSPAKKSSGKRRRRRR